MEKDRVVGAAFAARVRGDLPEGSVSSLFRPIRCASSLPYRPRSTSPMCSGHGGFDPGRELPPACPAYRHLLGGRRGNPIEPDRG